MAEKLALDTEIAVYKRLIDAMDKRLRWGQQIQICKNANTSTSTSKIQVKIQVHVKYKNKKIQVQEADTRNGQKAEVGSTNTNM